MAHKNSRRDQEGKNSDSDRSKRKQRRSERYQAKKRLGICRNCQLPICPRSTVFCESHLECNNRKGNADTPVAILRYRKLRNNARKIPVEMTQAEFATWYNSQDRACAYCGIAEEIMLATQKDTKKQRLTIDRMDNSVCYRLGNITLACFRCNNNKSAFFTYQQWKLIGDTMIKPRLREYHRLD